jgi:hypothetical protein
MLARWTQASGRLSGLLIALAISLAPAPEARADNEAQADVDSIVAAINEWQVGRVEIINLPEGTYTYAPIGPSDLEQGYQYKFIVAELLASNYGKDLPEALATIRVSPGGDYPDLRWGLLFFDRDDNRLGAIYLARGGERGVVNWTAVDIDGDLYLWLRRQFSDVFR